MTQESPRRIAIKTYGCQMNDYDSRRMAELLDPAGYELVEDASDADAVILNTCHIREKAVEKVYSELGRLRRLKEARLGEGKDMIVAVAGCVAQAEGEELVRRAPAVDLVIGPQAYHRLPDLIAHIAKTGSRIVETDLPAGEKFDALNGIAPTTAIPRGVAAFVTIQEGCDKFCTFCVVPYTRGAEFSRSVLEIEAEVRALARRGVREVTLLGQNVNAYHGRLPSGGDCGLARLLDHLSSIDEIDRIRYTTSHPRDMDDALIEVHARNPKVMPYLHLPVQSGSDRVLRQMNRQYTARSYVDLVSRIRKARPDIALSSDFIVGFPGETEGDFDETMSLVRAVGFAQAYSFKYSKRPGTPAADRSDQIEADVKSERLHRLQALLAGQQKEFNASFVGRHIDVLLERPGRREGQLVGRSPYLQPVHLEKRGARIGDIVRARVSAVGGNGLAAEIVEAP